MANFDSILNETIENVERPPLPPLGEYIFQVTKIPVQREVVSEKGNWDTLEFNVRGVSPTETVDPEAMAAYGKASNIMTRVSFMFDKNDETAAATTLFRLKTFLGEHIGLPLTGPLAQVLNASVNQKFMGTLRYGKPDPQGVQYPEISKTAPIA